MDIMLFKIVGFGLSFGLAGFFAGVIYERLSWNRLIADGVLPTPKRRTR